MENLQPACAKCNYRKGAQYGNAQRARIVKARNEAVKTAETRRPRNTPKAPKTTENDEKAEKPFFDDPTLTLGVTAPTEPAAATPVRVNLTAGTTLPTAPVPATPVGMNVIDTDMPTEPTAPVPWTDMLFCPQGPSPQVDTPQPLIGKTTPSPPQALYPQGRSPHPVATLTHLRNTNDCCCCRRCWKLNCEVTRTYRLIATKAQHSTGCARS